MRILVTGSSGFIARFLIPELAKRGHQVIGIDKRRGGEFGDYFRFTHANICNDSAIEAAMRDVDLIFHLAAEHKDFGVSDALYHETNVEGTAKLLRYAGQHGVRRVVFYSSVAVYGDSPIPTQEELVPNPQGPYGKTKLLAEGLIENWARNDRDRQAVILRPTVVFGPFNYANMYRLIESVARRKYIGVGSGRNIKSVAYVENVTAATLFLMDRMEDGVQIYNYADSPHLTTQELIRSIAANLEVTVLPVRIPKPVALACAFPFDIIAKTTGVDLPLTAKRIHKFTSPTHHLAERIRTRGFVPTYGLEQGIGTTVAWYRATQRAGSHDSSAKYEDRRQGLT